MQHGLEETANLFYLLKMSASILHESHSLFCFFQSWSIFFFIIDNLFFGFIEEACLQTRDWWKLVQIVCQFIFKYFFKLFNQCRKESFIKLCYLHHCLCAFVFLQNVSWTAQDRPVTFLQDKIILLKVDDFNFFQECWTFTFCFALIYLVLKVSIFHYKMGIKLRNVINLHQTAA